MRQVERLVATYRAPGRKRDQRRPIQHKSPHLRDLEDRARQRLGTKVTIEHADGQGKMTIHFYSDDDFQRVLEVLGLSE